MPKFKYTSPGIGFLDSRYVNVTGDTMTGNLTVPKVILSSGVIYPSADSTTAIQFNKADGTTNVVNIDTTNARVGIGTTGPLGLLHLNSSSATVNSIIDVADNDAYDALTSYRIQDAIIWNTGVDSSDANKFKIAAGGNWNNLGTGDLLTITTAGNVGIGTFPDTTAKINLSNTANQSAYGYGLYNLLTFTGTADQTADNRYKGIFSAVVVNAPYNVNYVSGFDTFMGTDNRVLFNITTGKTVKTALGFQAFLDWQATNAGTNTSVYGAIIQGIARASSVNTIGTVSWLDVGYLNNLGTTTITLQYGLRVRTMHTAATNYGVLVDAQNGTGTTNYGIYLGAISGATSNYSIYSLGGTMYHAGNIGIGTTGPGAKLDVQVPSGTTALAAQILNLQNAASAHGLYINTTRAASDAYALDVRSGGTSRLYVRADGNVGIGTTGPGANLHISGGESANYILSLARTSVGQANQWNLRMSSVYTGVAGSLYLHPSVAIADFVLSGAAGNPPTPQFVLQGSSGNVGIGTTAPGDLLQVGTGSSSSTRRAVRIGNVGNCPLNLQNYINNDADAAIFQNAYVDGGNTTSATYKWATTHGSFGSRGIEFQYGTGSGNGIIFYADSTATTLDASFTPTARMIIQNDGNVGVGTTSPGQILDVYKSQNGVTALRVINDNAGASALARLQAVGVSGEYGFIQWDSTNNRGDFEIGVGGQTPRLRLSYAAAAGNPQFSFTTDDGATETDAMTILRSGNVGIGTTSPTISDGVGLHLAGKILRIGTAKTPATAGAAGNAGEICWDADFLYVCIATNTWRRIVHATW